MEQRDYNAPTMENIMKMVKEMHSKVCEWGECKGCQKRMQDKGYGFVCYDCKQGMKSMVDSTEDIPF